MKSFSSKEINTSAIIDRLNISIPLWTYDIYIDKLVKKGYKVAICEQLGDPKTTKGIVERGVIKIVTPGTVVESNMLEERRNNYIMCIYKNS